MPFPSKRDHNVEFLPGRSRYLILGQNPSWVYHKMAAGQTLNGAAPERAGESAAECDPTAVSGGVAAWDSLTKGGLFTLLGNYKTAMVLEAVDNPGSATLSLVDRAGDATRAFPTTFPAKIGAHETIKATGGTAGSKIGVMVRTDTTRVI